MSKQPKFFCEHCGAEVKQHAKVCTHCGKFFSSVRCPMCGKSGAAKDFSEGCPYCGYAEERPVTGHNSSSALTPQDPLPTWLYVICAGALIGLISAFVITGLR
jgi:RNA polymerase subunit RPABC4/transcription elongation factor Spt4